MTSLPVLGPFSFSVLGDSDADSPNASSEASPETWQLASWLGRRFLARLPTTEQAGSRQHHERDQGDQLGSGRVFPGSPCRGQLTDVQGLEDAVGSSMTRKPMSRPHSVPPAM